MTSTISLIVGLIAICSLSFSLAVERKFLMITYNVEKHSPNLDPAKLLQLTERSGKPVDLIAIGFQEIHVTPSNFFGLSSSDDWSKVLKPTLIGAGYEKVARTRMLSQVMLVYARPEFRSKLSNVKIREKRTGFGGYVGNKGATAVTFEYGGKSFALINSHLAAGDEHFESRVDQYWSISKTLLAKPFDDHDLIIWEGDLNFRLFGSNAQQIQEKINKGVDSAEVRELKNQDSLWQARLANKAFVGFEEAPINFLPSYKFIVGTNKYDLTRKPAWTDRILYKTRKDRNGNSPIKVRQEEYRSNEEFTGSDHKPVSSIIVVDI